MRAEKAWKRLGATEPYFAVLSENQYLSAQEDGAARADFFMSGESHIAEVFADIHSIDSTFQPQRALDFGCGVGRLVIPLARRVHRVVGARHLTRDDFRICAQCVGSWTHQCATDMHRRSHPARHLRLYPLLHCFPAHTSEDRPSNHRAPDLTSRTRRLWCPSLHLRRHPPHMETRTAMGQTESSRRAFRIQCGSGTPPGARIHANEPLSNECAIPPDTGDWLLKHQCTIHESRRLSGRHPAIQEAAVDAAGLRLAPVEPIGFEFRSLEATTMSTPTID
jgi:hypothetical protein